MRAQSSQFVRETASAGELVRAEKEVICNLVALSRDAERINAIVNHPDVRPFIGPGGALDLSAAVERPENWFLMGEHGGFGLIWSAPGVHEVHTFILKTGRGQWAREAAAAVISYAAVRGDYMLWTKIAPEQVNVIAFATGMGMWETGQIVETFDAPYLVYKMEIG